jgi:uncharacterized membrane protein YfcA
MDYWMGGLAPAAFWAAMAITGFAGFVKGTVGFAMPLIMMGAFSSFLPPETALAGLILPTLVTNLAQAFRDGVGAAAHSAWAYRRFLTGTVVFILVSAPFVRVIPPGVFLMMLGVPITAYAALQLAGRSLAIRIEHRNRAEWGLGVVGGLYGGVSGIWGPPLIVYLLSTGVGKDETIRVQGVVFLLGAVVLTAAHLNSGVLNALSVPFSAALVLPAVGGMLLGFRAGKRLDQTRFRRWTQVLLVLTGLNLIRRALDL